MQQKFVMHDTTAEEMRHQERQTKDKMQISVLKATSVQLELESQRNVHQEHSATKQVRHGDIEVLFVLHLHCDTGNI